MPCHGVLQWDLSDLQRSLRLSPEDVRTYFTDGRRISFILERRLANEVLKGTIATSEGADFDLIDSHGRKWEVRSISTGGIYFCPSYMVGSGRSFRLDGFLAKLKGVHGFAVSDITQFPKVPYWLIETAQVLEWWNAGRLGGTTKISRDRALRLLEDPPTPEHSTTAGSF